MYFTTYILHYTIHTVHQPDHVCTDISLKSRLLWLVISVVFCYDNTIEMSDNVYDSG